MRLSRTASRTGSSTGCRPTRTGSPREAARLSCKDSTAPEGQATSGRALLPDMASTTTTSGSTLSETPPSRPPTSAVKHSCRRSGGTSRSRRGSSGPTKGSIGLLPFRGRLEIRHGALLPAPRVRLLFVHVQRDEELLHYGGGVHLLHLPGLPVREDPLGE